MKMHELITESLDRNIATSWMKRLEATMYDYLDAYAVGEMGPDVLEEIGERALKHMPREFHQWVATLDEDESDELTDLIVDLHQRLVQQLF